jgi:DUF4097 and DUF4098 domain-containing protein YvlB
MSSTVQEFTVGDRPELVISVSSVDVNVVEGSDGSIGIEVKGSDRNLDLLEIVHTGDVVTVRTKKGGRRWRGRGSSIRLTVPTSTAVTARTASGDLRISVPVSDAEIDTSSGDIHLASVSGRGKVKAASGDITIGSTVGEIRISTASGDVRLDEVDGDVSIGTASGDVRLGAAHGSIEVKTASGDVTIRRFSGVMLEGGAMSGDFQIGLVAGMSIDADIQTRSGRFRNLTTPASETSESSISTTMRLRTMSGDVTLR